MRYVVLKLDGNHDTPQSKFTDGRQTIFINLEIKKTDLAAACNRPTSHTFLVDVKNKKKLVG